MMNWFCNFSLYFAWVISLIGFLCSLYIGEVLHLEPCSLCWYQRTALFPLALLLGIMAFRDDRKFIGYCLVLAVAGELFAIYQILEQYFPALRTAAFCGQTASCRESIFTLFGFLTFPMFSAIGFLLIGIFLCCALRGSKPR